MPWTGEQRWFSRIFFFNDTATTEIYTLSLHDALPISVSRAAQARALATTGDATRRTGVYDIVRGKDWPAVYTGRVLANDFVVRWHGHERELVEHLDDARAEFAHAVEEIGRAHV